MAKAAKKPHQSLRMFESDLLEKASHVHPSIPAIMWIPFIAYLIWRATAVEQIPAATFALLSVSGFLSWTLAEYVLHRWIFHWVNETAFSKRIHFIIHGNHHDDPNDPTRLVMPPVPAIILAVLLYNIFVLPLGPVLVLPFFAFFLVGYLGYDYTHYYIHHASPKKGWGKFIKQHHMLHHFAAHGAKWGVSTPIWDYVFGTMTEPKRPRGESAAHHAHH